MSVVDVVALKIDECCVSFECPFCRTSYYKNGQPRINSKPHLHIHGSSRDTSNRVIERSPHCNLIPQRFKPNIDCSFTFRITIDDTTIKS